MNPQNTPYSPPSPDGAQFPGLEATGRAMPYGLPQDYFKGLPDRMIAGIRAAEGLDAAVALPEASTPMQVPAGYFDELPGRVASRVKTQPSAPVMKMPLLRPLRYAAAAIALLAAGLGVWRAAQPAVSAPQAVAVSDMSADDIEAFNEETGDVPAGGSESSAAIDVTGTIAGLSPDDITAWEDATGEQVADGYDVP